MLPIEKLLSALSKQVETLEKISDPMKKILFRSNLQKAIRKLRIEPDHLTCLESICNHWSEAGEKERAREIREAINREMQMMVVLEDQHRFEIPVELNEKS